MSFIDPDETKQNSFVDPDEKQSDWTKEYPNAYKIALQARELLGPTLEAGGAAVGGLTGTALGPVGTVAGAGLGYGISKEILDLADQALKLKQPKTPQQLVQNAVENVAMGSAVEGSVPVAKTLFGAGASKIKDAYNKYSFDKAKKLIEESLGSDLSGARVALKSALPQNTAGQIVAESGINAPAFQAMYSDVIGRSPQTAKFFSDQAKQRELARLAELQRVTPNLEQSVAARSSATSPLYEEAGQATLPGRSRVFEPFVVGKNKPVPEIDAATGQPILRDIGRESVTNQPILQQMQTRAGQNQMSLRPSGFEFDESLKPLMDRPVIKNAFEQAEQIAQNKGSSIYDKFGNLTGEGAHSVKLALDDAISNSPKEAIGKNAQQAMMGARQEYLNWLEQKNPVYQKARETYASMSAPVNQSKVLTELTDILQNPVGGERLSPFMNALTRGETTLLKRVNQNPRFGGISDVLSKEQMGAVNKASGEMIAEKQMQQQATEGKQALAMLLDTNIPKWKLPALLMRPLAILNKGLGELEKRVGNKTMDILVEGMKSGKNLDDILSGVPIEEKTRVLNMVRNPDMWLGKRSGIPLGLRSYIQGPPEKEQVPPKTLADLIAQKQNEQRY